MQASELLLDSAGLAELKSEHIPAVQWGLCVHIGVVTALPSHGWSHDTEGGSSEQKTMRAWILVTDLPAVLTLGQWLHVSEAVSSSVKEE